MNKWIIILSMFLLLMSVVSATTFKEDTMINEGNINYIFSSGVSVDNFDVTTGGIKINNGDFKFGITIQGGEVDVKILEFNETKKIELFSTVPQSINFIITENGVRQYLYDGDSYHLNNYNIGTEPVKFDIVNFKNKENKTNLQNSVLDYKEDIQKLDWWKQKMVEFEISSYEDENGIIQNKTFAITYLAFTLFMIILIIGFLVWWNKK